MNPLRHFLHDLVALPRDLKLVALSIFFWGTGESLFFFVAPLYMEQLGATPVKIGDLYGWAAAMAACTISFVYSFPHSLTEIPNHFLKVYSEMGRGLCALRPPRNTQLLKGDRHVFP